ncbi:hypothetical protein BDA96_04G297100 [Sorghum bicolor]|uniref:Uncharacterized protein n=1 Tax=Sorghum bicolor TaxID=4558 RepID=A0A921R629_SORBI|nr:hypothetical protein BDA96_04G297100 [Sorghum bicolor]
MVHNQTSSINSANLMPLTNTTNYVPLSTWISGHSCLGFRLWGREYLGRNQLRGLVCRARRISLRGLDLIHPGSILMASGQYQQRKRKTLHASSSGLSPLVSTTTTNCSSSASFLAKTSGIISAVLNISSGD